jgi:hypothetical protein
MAFLFFFLSFSAATLVFHVLTRAWRSFTPADFKASAYLAASSFALASASALAYNLASSFNAASSAASLAAVASLNFLCSSAAFSAA